MSIPLSSKIRNFLDLQAKKSAIGSDDRNLSAALAPSLQAFSRKSLPSSSDRDGQFEATVHWREGGALKNPPPLLV